MSLHPKPDPQLDALLVQVIDDGELSPEQQTQLVELLRSDPASRARYLDHMHLLAMLRWVESAPPAQGASITAGDDAAAPPKQEISPAPLAALDLRSSPLRFAAAVATLTVAAWVLLISFVATEAPPLVESRGAPIVAQLTGLIDGHWARGQSFQVGESLQAGKVLRLDAGLAEVTFRDGTRAVLEGPTRLCLTSGNSGVLQQGRLSVAVPPKAAGFTVTTPSAVLVDLGTEFAVQVGDEGHTEVHVFDGRVRVERLDRERPEGETFGEIYLTTNQALRIEQHTGRTRRMPIDAERRQMLDTRQRFIAYRHTEAATGQQETLATLGHDFVVRRTVVVTRLGVFDSDADGLRRIITAELWSRDDRGTPDNFGDDRPLAKLATLTFTPVNPGALVGASRFKPLPAEMVLAPGNYSIVAYGYGPHEPFGNSKFAGDDLYKSVDDGGGALEFVGAGRFGSIKSQSHTTFPLTLGEGPADRYRAGTFEFYVPGREDNSPHHPRDGQPALNHPNIIPDSRLPQREAAVDHAPIEFGT